MRLPMKTMIKDQESLHSTQTLLDLDYNPIKVNTLATTGQDSTVRFWDLRKIDAQGKMLETRCVKQYNPTDVMSQNENKFFDKISVSNSNANSSVGGAEMGGRMA